MIKAKYRRIFLSGLLALGLSASVFAHNFGSYYGGTTYKAPAQAFNNRMLTGGHTRFAFGGNVAYFYDNLNDAYIDQADISFTCAQGDGLGWLCADGSYLRLYNIDDQHYHYYNHTYNYNHNGWGDWGQRLKWKILYVGSVIQSPLEAPESWKNVWIDPDFDGDVFDGCHMALGFRSEINLTAAVDVTTAYTDAICAGGYLLDEWFFAIEAYGYPYTESDKGCVVYDPDHRFDTLTSYGSYPAADSTALAVVFRY